MPHTEFSFLVKVVASSTQVGALQFVSDFGWFHTIQADSQRAKRRVCQFIAGDLVDESMQCSTRVRFIHVPGGNVSAWLWTAYALRDSQRFGRRKSINLRSAEELQSLARK